MPVFSLYYNMIKLLRSGGKTFYLAMIFIVGFLLLPWLNNLVWGQLIKNFFAPGSNTFFAFILDYRLIGDSHPKDLSFKPFSHLKTQRL